MSVQVRTNILLRMVHRGQQSKDPEVFCAAESIRSLIALNLKYETIVVDKRMLPHYAVLRKAN